MGNVLPIADNTGVLQEIGSGDQIPENNLNHTQLNRLLALIILELTTQGFKFESLEINDQLKFL